MGYIKVQIIHGIWEIQYYFNDVLDAQSWYGNRECIYFIISCN